MDLLDRLLDHDRWATEHLLAASRSLTDGQLDQPFDIGLQTLRATFAHIIVNIDFWSGLMTGHPIDYAPPSDRSLAELTERAGRSYDAFIALARRLRDEGRLDETFIDHWDVAKSMGGTILHVVLHNAEHRAEAVHIITRLTGADPIEVDFGLWDYAVLAGKLDDFRIA